MKIAVTAENNNGLESTVAQHFGHAAYFMLVVVTLAYSNQEPALIRNSG